MMLSSRPRTLAAPLTLALLSTIACSRSRGADLSILRTVAVARVARETLERRLELAAEFRPFQEIDIHAKVAGYLKKIFVDVGDHVKRGQVLAVLEVPELANEINQVTAAAESDEQEIKRAQGDLERAEAAHEVSHLAYTRLAAVAQSQPELIAGQDLDDAQGRDRVAEAQVAGAKAALAAAEGRLRAALANQQRVQALYAYTRMTAPFDGVITQRFADTGAMVASGTTSEKQIPVVRLSQNDRLRLTLPVPESAAGKVRIGAPASVKVPDLGKTFEGQVARFSDKVELDTRTMVTEIDVPNPRYELVPGMYATASLLLERRDNTLTVPVESVEHEGGKGIVLRVSPQNVIERESVTLGLETPTRIEVLSELKEGDSVVVGSQSGLNPGDRVVPKLVATESGQHGGH